MVRRFRLEGPPAIGNAPPVSLGGMAWVPNTVGLHKGFLYVADQSSSRVLVYELSMFSYETAFSSYVTSFNPMHDGAFDLASSTTLQSLSFFNDTLACLWIRASKGDEAIVSTHAIDPATGLPFGVPRLPSYLYLDSISASSFVDADAFNNFTRQGNRERKPKQYLLDIPELHHVELASVPGFPGSPSKAVAFASSRKSDALIRLGFDTEQGFRACF